MGSNTETVYIDNISLFEIDPSTSVVPAQSRAAEQIRVRQRNSRLDITLDNTSEGDATVRLFDLKGNVIRSAEFKTGATSSRTVSLSTEGLAKGYYIVKVHSGRSLKRSGLVL
ncbi:MAG: T9SS type A sorting domain-containing protein, partial [Chitinispirillaceae bacterium]